jgi:adenylate cyclase
MVSSHMTRIAEIEIESMAEVSALGLRERVLAEASQRGLEHSDVGWVLLYAFRRRLEEGLRRRTTLEAGDQPMLAVGFVDLVEFARTSGSMQTDDLGRLLGRFEGLASDIITEAGGRVVKLIGDEAMLVFPTPEGAARGAIELVDACAVGDLPSARAGLSLGPVLARGGDYFGRAVNLASRLVDVAPPDTCLADDRFAEALVDNVALAIEPHGRKRLKGLGSVHAWRLSSAGG